MAHALVRRGAVIPAACGPRRAARPVARPVAQRARGSLASRAAARAAAASQAGPVRPLLIDNYDSYSYNLFQILAEVYGGEPVAAARTCTTRAPGRSCARPVRRRRRPPPPSAAAPLPHRCRRIPTI